MKRVDAHYSAHDIETRILAATPGCEVECIDLSQDYCVAAMLLNRRENSLASAAEMSETLGRHGFEDMYFADVSEEPLPPPPEGTLEVVEQAPLSLSVYVDELAKKAENAARSLRERQIRLFRGVFRVRRARVQ